MADYASQVSLPRRSRMILALVSVSLVAVCGAGVWAAWQQGAADTDQASFAASPGSSGHPKVGDPSSSLDFGMTWTGENGAVFGTAPREEPGAARSDAAVPEYLAVVSRDGLTLAGFVKSDQVLSAGLANPSGEAKASRGVAVYGDDGRTQVGSFVPGIGYVDATENPQDIPVAPDTGTQLEVPLK